MLSFFPRGVLDEILNLIESVSEGFPTYFCNNFCYCRKLDELCKQFICFISIVNLTPKKHAFKLYVCDFGHFFRDVAIKVNGNLLFSDFIQSLTSCLSKLKGQK